MTKGGFVDQTSCNHVWGKWLGKGKKRHRFCINGWCPMGQDRSGRMYVARPKRRLTDDQR